jgi:hypothetical protein
MSLNFKYIDNKNITKETFIKNKLLVDNVIVRREKIKHQWVISNMRGEELDLSVVDPFFTTTTEPLPDFIESNDSFVESNDDIYPYYSLLDDFVSVYNIDKEDVFINPKVEYRYFC